MEQTKEITTTVLPGHRVEISTPEVPVGTTISVTMRYEPKAPPPWLTLDEIIAGIPPDQRAFRSAEEVNRYLDEERDSWDR